jgi:hypothetical protein
MALPEHTAPQYRGPSATQRAVKFGWSIYQQVAAVLAAFGVAALVDHWWHIGWRAWLGSLVGIWGHTVRPAMAAVLHVLVTVPLSWAHIHFEVPLWARDYLAVGLTILLSLIREDRMGSSQPAGLRYYLWPFAGDLNVPMVLESTVVDWAPTAILLWPAALGVFIRFLFDHDMRRFAIAAISPVAYLAILFALNFWVLR